MIRPEYSLHELYKIALESFRSNTIKESTAYSVGESRLQTICYTFVRLHSMGVITREERFRIDWHFKSQKPTKDLHKEFYNDETFIDGHARWWKNKTFKLYSESNDQRGKLLEKLIKITKDIDE